MSAETQKPWEMNQKEYEQWYQDNMGEKDNIPYSERVSQWKRQGKLSLILGKPILDKSDNSSIMTSSEGKENDNNRRHDLRPENTRTESAGLRETDTRKGMEKDESGSAGRESQGESERGEGHSRSLHTDRDGAVRSVAEGNQGRDTGEGQRLTPKPEPKDIELNGQSDIGFNAGAATRFDANIAAIKLSKQIESENRLATPDEQKILSKYSGFGDSAMGEAFPVSERAKGWNYDEKPWGKRRKELQEITTPKEFAAIEGSRLNAFYTTPPVIDAMWKTLDNMGVGKLDNPRVMEPGAGSGRFLGYEPKDITNKSERVAVELDTVTGRILKELYPKTETYVMGFEQAPIPKDSIDVAISNVPFGNYQVYDPTFKGDKKKFTHAIHNYYFVKTMEELRPGGVLAFITTHETMDAPSSKPIRQYLADQADMVGAFRLPNNAFPDTSVVTDVIFMRKRMAGEKPGDQTWVNSSKVELPIDSRTDRDGKEIRVPLNQNDYFTKHPGMIMGKATGNGSMNPHKQYTEGEYTVEPNEDVALSTLLNKAVAKMPRDIVTNAPRQAMPKRVYGQSNTAIREGTRIIGEDGRIYVQHGETQESANLTATEEAKVKDMMAIRDAAKKVVDIQVHDQPESVLKPALDDLNTKYKAYVLANGTLNSNANSDLMDRDPDAPFLKALENNSVFSIPRKDLTEDETRLTKVIKGTLPVEETDIDKIQMPIFKKRIIHGLGDKPINSYADAESVVNNEVGSLDYDLMAEKLGKTREDVIAHLAAQKLIYKNPMTGEWEPADKYLTGDVRTKLKQAEAAAAARPNDFKGNYDDLKVVQPADIPAGQIAVHMGAPWIPESDVNDFVVDLMEVDKNEKQKRGYGHWNDPEKVMKYVQYVPETGKWHVAGKSDFGGKTTNMTETYGTEEMPAHEIIGAILNGKLVEVKKWDGTHNDKGEKNMVRDAEGTVAAQEKAKLIQTKFLEWIWSDPDRTDRLARSYNDKFNNYRPRTFDGKHLDLPGISEKWHKQMLSHQKDAVWRVVQDRTALLAHEVGFGKTAVMVTSGMELRRMGLSRKNLYVVPKATHGQFRDDFLDIYPTAKILFPEDDDFTPAKRPEFISRAVTGDWDAVIISDSQFEKIPVRPETELRFQQEELDNLTAAVEAAGDDKTTQKQLEKKKKNTEVKIIKLQEKLKEKSDKAVYFEDLGVDQMYVDEADAYKNLKFATSMGRVKGLPNSEADRAWDMYTKTRTLQEDKHAGVVFATGTPIANTIAEMYTMMRYLQEPMLEEKGLQHFDAWAKTFGETTESLEQTPTGLYKVTQRFSKFGNAPELSNIWQMTADIRVADEVLEMVEQRPKIRDEQGKERRIVVPTPGDQALADYMKELVDRADQLKGKPEKGGDNMLKISSDARKASLDMRLVKANAPINPKGKVTVACTKITDIYKETTPDKGTQLVFLDLATPKAQEKEPEHDANGVLIETDDDTKEETALLKDVYAGIKAQLIANGIPEKEIAFIHDAKNIDQRKALYAKVNSGEIRVLIGSTGKMGAGVNVQKRAAALHHLDAPWRPRDIEQREGRVIRQGNVVYGPVKDENGKILNPGKGVRIYTYVTEKSFDEFMWQAIEAKSKAIKSIMRRAVPPRSIEDVDSFTLSASEAKAIASGNPDVFKQVSLKNAVARYAMLKASHTDQVIRAKSQIRALPKQIEDLNGVIGKMEKDAALVKENPKFAMKVQGDNFEERSEAGPAILNAIKHAANNEKIGEYQGFDVKVLDHGPQQGYELVAENPETGQRYSGGTSIMYADITGPGAVVRLDNIIKKVPQRLEDSRKQLKDAEKNLETYKGLEAKPFEYEKQLDSAEKELDRISKKLQGQKVEGNESDNYVPEPEPEEIEPEYHYSARGEEIKAEDEVDAVKAEVGNVEKETVVKAEPAAQVVEIVEKMPEPEKETYHGPPVATVERISFEEQPKVEAPIVEPEKPKLTPFPGNDPQKTSGSFNVYNLNAYISGKHLTTPAEKITIPGFEEYSFFIARPTTTGGKFSNKDWDIYETTTGMSIGALRDTKQKAIDEATHKLKDFIGKEKLTKAIADGLEKQGRERGLAPQPKVAADIANVATEPKAEVEAAEKAAETTTTPEPKAPASKEEETPGNPKLEDELYVNMDGGHGFKSIKAKKVVIPGYEKFDLYLHHPAWVDKKGEVVEDKDHWGISEGRSGLYLGDDITSPQADWAVDRLKSKLARKMTPEKLEQSVENAVKNTGESPKYETETPIAKMQRQVHEINNMPKSETAKPTKEDFVRSEVYKESINAGKIGVDLNVPYVTKLAENKYDALYGQQPAAPKVEEPALNPFIGLYKGKQYESHAVSLYAAQKEIAKRVGARHEYDVSVYAATETEPLAAAIEHEKELPEETPFIEEGGPAKRKSKPSIETQAVAHVQQQIPEEAPIVEGEVKRKSKPSIDNEYGKPVREPTKDSFKAQQELHEKSLGWTHKDQIKQALAEGKPVPPEVLKDYPDLETKRLYGKAGLTKGAPAITKVHDDGDLTVKKGDTNYVVTTEGKTFKEVKPEPELKDVIQHSHELGEKATRGGQTESRGPHKAEKAGSIPAPATIAAENKVLKEVKRVFERAAAKDMPVRIATGHWDKDADGTWKYVRDVNTPQVHSSKANPSVKRENLYLTVIKGTRQLPQPKGTPKPHMDMKRQGKVINIKGVGLARNIPKGRVSRKRGS